MIEKTDTARSVMERALLCAWVIPMVVLDVSYNACVQWCSLVAVSGEVIRSWIGDRDGRLQK